MTIITMTKMMVKVKNASFVIVMLVIVMHHWVAVFNVVCGYVVFISLRTVVRSTGKYALLLFFTVLFPTSLVFGPTGRHWVHYYRCDHEIVGPEEFARRQSGAVRHHERQRLTRDARDACDGRLGYGRRRVLQSEIDRQHRQHHAHDYKQRPKFASPYDDPPLLQAVPSSDGSNSSSVGSGQPVDVGVTGKIGRRSTAPPQQFGVISYDNDDHKRSGHDDNNDDASIDDGKKRGKEQMNKSHAAYWSATRAGRGPTEERLHHEAREAALLISSTGVPCRTGSGDGSYDAESAAINVSSGKSVDGKPFSHRGYWQHVRHPSVVSSGATSTGNT
jgi:hypothetical protein